jgi:hypothetical protein
MLSRLRKLVLNIRRRHPMARFAELMHRVKQLARLMADAQRKTAHAPRLNAPHEKLVRDRGPMPCVATQIGAAASSSVNAVEKRGTEARTIRI